MNSRWERPARVLPVYLAVALVAFAIPASAQVRQSYFERSADTKTLIQKLPVEDRVRIADSDRLAESFEDAMDAGRYLDAIDITNQQIEIRREVFGARHPELIPALIGHGFACWRQGRYAEGEQSLRLAREIISEHQGKSHPEMARCLDLLGLCRMAQGFLDEAKKHYFDALSIALATCGEENALAIACYDDLGAVHQEQWDFARSEPFRRKALALARKLYGTEHITTARLTFNLGKLLLANGDRAGAEAHFREALDLRRRLLGPEHPDVAFTMIMLWQATKYKGDCGPEEEAFLRKALRINRKALGEQHPNVTWSLQALASLYFTRGDYEKTLSINQDDVALRKRIYGEKHREVVRALRHLASTYMNLGQYEEAERCLYEARDMFPTPWAMSYELGLVALHRGDLARAEDLFTQTTEDFERNRLKRTAYEKRINFGSGASPYLHLAALRLLLGKTENAWPAAERYLGRALFDLLISYGERPLTTSETAYEDSLKNTLADLERQYAVLRAESKNDINPGFTAAIETTRTRLLETEADLGAFREEICVKYPAAEGEVFSLEEIQDHLEDQTAILGWIDWESPAGEQMSWAYVIRAEGPVLWTQLRAANAEELETRVTTSHRTFLYALAGAASWPYRVTSADKVFWAAKNLYAKRLAPAASYLDGISRLVVIPCGYMQGIPVEVLLDEESRFVGDRFTVSYASSGTVYAWLREHAREFLMQNALIVGDPYLSAAGKDGVSIFPALPASGSEVAHLASLLPGCVTLSGGQASEQGLVELAGSLHNFGTIHISTHACVDPEQPQRSYLALSQANLPDPLECALAGTRIYDGKLTLHEIVREWRLDADLVTLSACQTALGKEARGEGVVGFAHAFLQAGARSVVVSLWEVDDEATSMLMGRFYENLTGAYSAERMPGCRGPMSKTAALCEAKRWLRGYKDESGRTPYRHPAYWSAFILVGDPG